MRNSLFRLAMCTLFQGQRRLPLVWCWYQCETTELAPWYQDPAPQSWHKRHLSSTVCCPPNPLQYHLQIESTAKIRLKFDGYIQYLRARTTNSICTHLTSIVPHYACTIPMQCKLDDGTCTARVGLACLICWWAHPKCMASVYVGYIDSKGNTLLLVLVKVRRLRSVLLPKGVFSPLLLTCKLPRKTCHSQSWYGTL